ncbi:MAG: OAM dimerization domain-containing protein, partial [Candidatus Cloacimonetes bacterium]|nr:OAM dimerization domain-containing protein [Candidatus Cloacimonadota bacterium]
MTQIVKPYGDTQNDGKVQLSFALPVKPDAQGKEAARMLILSMGFDEAEIT